MTPPTEVWTLNAHEPSRETLLAAASLIVRGRLVAFPTETVYGLGANALDREAVLRIFTAKGRPADDPLIVHLRFLEDVLLVAADFPAPARGLAERFWPGPLTLILPRHPRLPLEVTAGLDRVAVRVPAHPVALGLLEASGVPIAAPSANRFSHTSPTTAQHVLDDLSGRVDLILDGGPTPIGVESTVLDVLADPPVILRPGGVTREQLQEVLGRVVLAAPGTRRSASPGQRPRHYAPRARLVLCAGPSLESDALLLARTLSELAPTRATVGVLAVSELIPLLPSGRAEPFDLGSVEDLPGVARRLFASLRELEATGVGVILTHLMPPEGLGLAINDRLQRAASQVLRELPPRAAAQGGSP